MLYRHKVTGAVIDVNSTMGGAWQAVKPAGAGRDGDQAVKQPEAKAPAKKTTPAKAVKKNGVRKSD